MSDMIKETHIKIQHTQIIMEKKKAIYLRLRIALLVCHCEAGVDEVHDVFGWEFLLRVVV